jgi:nucleoside-diphosphate-sugar epimerase
MDRHKTKSVLVSGASGFLGRHCVPLLLDRGYEVHAVKHNRVGLKSRENLYFHEGDLLNSVDRKRLFSEIKPSHLLHLAWHAVPGKYWTSLENLKWVQASLEMLIEFLKNGGKRLVCAGSVAEYDWSDGHCTEKQTPLNPSTLYGVCKNSLHEIIKRVSVQERLPYAWGRLFFVYGPHEYPERLVPSTITSLLNNRETRCLNPGLIRDFLYIKDAADAFVSLMDSHVTGPVNIASGTPVYIKDVVKGIGDKLNKNDLIKIAPVDSSADEPASLTADVDRLRHEVGWMPVYDMDRGLKETIEWWRVHT